MTHNSSTVVLGLKANWKQFSLLVIINAFVGAMVGMERTIFPQFAEERFQMASTTAILSFIIAFGIAKSLANYFTGVWANKIGRRNLLLIGWGLAIPVPVLLLYAPTWNWVVFANILLGISQGLAWSSTIVMKMDLVGIEDRGLAMGLNEFTGYLSLGLVALLTAWIAEEYALFPYPFYLGFIIAIVGFLLSFIFVRDTGSHVSKEQTEVKAAVIQNIFLETSFTNKNLSSITQAGLVSNLNDGMIWGLLPIFLAGLHFDLEKIGIISAVYPMVWGIGQLFTGKLADSISKKKMLFCGMLIQGLAICGIPFISDFWVLVFLAVMIGFGTACVYPTFLAAIAQYTAPVQRAESIGVFRLWRDLGYAIGAISSGILADFFGIEIAILFIGAVTIVSGLVVQIRMDLD